MAEQRKLLTREALIEMLETQWRYYLPTIESLTDEEQQHYARQQGYASLRDLLAHITAWMGKAVEVVPIIARGGHYRGDWKDDDDFNARAVEQARDQTLEQAKADFENTRTALARMIAELPVEAMNNPNIYPWLNGNVIVHYLEHEPPAFRKSPPTSIVRRNKHRSEMEWWV